MPAVVLVGAQWGDEGKGKATDLLGDSCDYVVKFNGGNNAGHTVVVGDEKYALHLLPSGILTPGVVPVIANGVVVDIEVLFEELEGLESRGVDVSKLRVSANAHLITQYHRTLDKVTERFLGKRQIGTTGRGIGPAYADKINRVGLRLQDLFDENILRQKVEGALDQKNHLLVKVYNRRAIGVDEVVDDLLSYVDRLRPMVVDTSLVLNQALDAGKTVLFEGDVAGNVVSFVNSGEREVGYWIGREFWGRGVATRALAGFLRLEARRPLCASVARHNVASIKVLQNCGFRVSGEEPDELLLELEAYGEGART